MITLDFFRSKYGAELDSFVETVGCTVTYREEVGERSSISLSWISPFDLLVKIVIYLHDDGFSVDLFANRQAVKLGKKCSWDDASGRLRSWLESAFSDLTWTNGYRFRMVDSGSTCSTDLCVNRLFTAPKPQSLKFD